MHYKNNFLRNHINAILFLFAFLVFSIFNSYENPIKNYLDYDSPIKSVGLKMNSSIQKTTLHVNFTLLEQPPETGQILLKTSPGTQGIMVIYSPTRTALIYYSNNILNNYALKLSPLTLHTNHSIKVTIISQNSIKVWIDRNCAAIISDPKINFQYSTINYINNNVSANDRLIKISDFKINTLFYKKNNFYLINYLQYIFLFISFFFLIKLMNQLRSQKEQNQFFEKKQISPNRLGDSLLLIRAFACFTVIAGHSFLITFPINYHSQKFIFHGINFSFLAFVNPQIGIWIFFVLSGYLMGKAFFLNRYSITKTGIINFYKNRFFRIYPLYAFSILIIMIVGKIFSGKNNVDFSFISILNNLFFLSAKNIPIGALWSIITEIHYYLIVPALYFIWITFNKKNKELFFIFSITVFSGIALRIILFTPGIDWTQYIYTPFICNLDLFLLGFLINPLLLQLSQKKMFLSLNFIFLIFLAVLYLFCSYISSKTFGQNFTITYFYICFMPTIIGILTAITIFLIEINEKKRFTAHKNTLLLKIEYLGILTYAMYVWHEPIYISLSKFLNGMNNSSMHNFLLFVLIFILLYFIGILSHHYIEKPFEKIKKF